MHNALVSRRSRTLLVAPCLLALVVLAPACRAEEELHFDSVKATLKDKPFTLEVADTEAKRERGLMNRDSMPADHGMIFIFDKADNVAFWMKNTKIALDLVYLDETGKVIGVHPLKPMDETNVNSEKPAKYAIELNAGTAEKIGLKAGDTVALPEKVLKAAVHPDDK